MKNWKEEHLGYILYEVVDLESGQRVKGTAAALSGLTGVREYRISRLARENRTYQGRYQFRKLQEEKTKGKTKRQLLYQQWDEVHRIYLELIAGRRCIQKAADGKRYAVRVS